MEKLVYLIWERPSIDPAALRARFLDDLAPRLLALGPHALQMDLDDEHAQMQSMVPGPRRRAPGARVRFDLARRARRRARRTKPSCARPEPAVAGYLVTESMYREYGDNEHAHEARLARRNPLARHHHADDLRQACGCRRRHVLRALVFGHQSPMSEDMQPRARYVRNAVVRPMTPGAPRYRAIVEESWPSVEHVTNLHTFFGAARTRSWARTSGSCSTARSCSTTRRRCATTRLSEYIFKS